VRNKVKTTTKIQSFSTARTHTQTKVAMHNRIII